MHARVRLLMGVVVLMSLHPLTRVDRSPAPCTMPWPRLEPSAGLPGGGWRACCPLVSTGTPASPLNSLASSVSFALWSSKSWLSKNYWNWQISKARYQYSLMHAVFICRFLLFVVCFCALSVCQIYCLRRRIPNLVSSMQKLALARPYVSMFDWHAHVILLKH